ncbi:MAG: DUF4177 domain-containing protein [Chloroflexi bacterium]|nr:DUF4177 domain-containing protein [Chloroflexota bacterium]
MVEYEYKVVELNGIPDNDENALEEAGKQGWELVAVVPAGTVAVAGAVRKMRFLGYLKREIG